MLPVSLEYSNGMQKQVRNQSYVTITITYTDNGSPVVLTFDNSNIINLDMTNKIDPVSRFLPVQTLKFTLIDYDKKFDPDNPSGLGDLLDQKADVELKFGYMLDSGVIYYLTPYKWIVDSRPIFSQGMVRFFCKKILSEIKEIHYESQFNQTLYDMASSLITEAGLTSDSIILDNSLQNYTSENFLPSLPFDQCLQLIAFAGKCTLFCDANNKINIKAFTIPESSTINNFWLDYNTIRLNSQNQSQVILLQDLNVSYYSIKSGSSETIFSQTFTFNTPPTSSDEFIINFENPATNVTFNSDSHIATSSIYADCAIITFDGTTGDITVTATGNIMNVQEVTLNVSNAHDSGESTDIKNVLITNQDWAEEVANWYGNYIQLRNTYACEYRGNPELECGDFIYSRSYYNYKMEVLVLSNRIFFNGTLIGQAMVKKIRDGTLTNEIWTSNEATSGEISG